MTMPNVSVVIPVHNGTNYLREAIDSVLAQTYTDYEVLVIDDGSTDGTWKLIQSYGERVRGFRKPNGGVASALNCGIQNARGEYIDWLSHDDLFLPHTIERQVLFLQENPDLNICYSDYIEIDANRNIIREVQVPWFPRQETIRVLFTGCYINGCTMIINKVCFERVGVFNELLMTTQDIEMWFRLLRYYEFGHISEPLLMQRNHAQQGSAKITTHRQEEYTTLLAMFEESWALGIFPEFLGHEDNNRIIARAYTWIGEVFATHFNWYDYAEEQFKRAIEIYPNPFNPAIGKIWINRLKNTRHRLSIRRRFSKLLGIDLMSQRIQ